MKLLAERQRVWIVEMTKLHLGHVNQPNRLAAQCKKTYKYDSNFLIRVSQLTFTDYFVLEESLDDTASHIHSYVQLCICHLFHRIGQVQCFRTLP